MTKSRKLAIATKLVRLNRNSAAVVADKSQSAASNKSENQNAAGTSNQSAAGASKQSAAGSASNQSAGGASDQNAGGASNQNAGDASDEYKGGASASTGGDDSPLGRAEVFSYGELEKAADNFSQMITEDRFTRVYLGELQTAQGILSTYVQIVAVKMLNVGDLHRNGLFLSDVMKLSLLRHPNLVNLIGFSVETAQPLVAYEFMDFKSLDKHLFDLKSDSEPLNWHTRLRIALGTASALHYLHNEAVPAVIFGGVKTPDILLDGSFIPRLFYFRLRLSGGRVIGNKNRGTLQSDINAFGMLMLELITGCRHEEIVQEQGSIKKLVDWLYLMLVDTDKLYEVVDPHLGKNNSRESLYRAAKVAAVCVQEDVQLIKQSFSMVQVLCGIMMAIAAMSSDELRRDQITIGEGSTAAENADEMRSVTRVEDPQLAVEDPKGKDKKKILDD